MSVGADRLSNVAGYAVGLVQRHAHYRPGSADDEAVSDLAKLAASSFLVEVAEFAARLDAAKFAAGSASVSFRSLAPEALKQMGVEV